MITQKEVSGSIQFFDRKKGFGFIAIAGAPDAFFHARDLRQQGFEEADAKDGVSVLIDFGLSDKGKPAALKIHKIGQKLAIPTCKRTVVDQCNGNVVLKVVPFDTPSAPYYEVRDGGIGGSLISETPILAEARLKIGKVITAPVSSSHGKKTNVPKSAVVAQKGEKSKKKAA